MDTNFNNVQYTFKQPYLEKIHIDYMHPKGDLVALFLMCYDYVTGSRKQHLYFQSSNEFYPKTQIF